MTIDNNNLFQSIPDYSRFFDRVGECTVGLVPTEDDVREHCTVVDATHVREQTWHLWRGVDADGRRMVAIEWSNEVATLCSNFIEANKM